jgi:hypothetical protein
MRAWIVVAIGAVAIVAVAARPVAAQPTACDPVRIEAARRALDREADSARTWNLGWGIAYTVFAGAQVGLAVAEFAPGRTFNDAAAAALYTGAGKATIGALSRLVVPLRLPRVRASGDACTDAAAIDRARLVVARKERNTFWLTLGGGLAMHAVVGTYLVVGEDSWRDALTSFGLGAVVSVASLYTLPKHSWRHRGSLVVVPSTSADSIGLVVVGGF